jgi:hypothetical protein
MRLNLPSDLMKRHSAGCILFQPPAKFKVEYQQEYNVVPAQLAPRSSGSVWRFQLSMSGDKSHGRNRR